MSAGTAYAKRYVAGFLDLPTTTTPIDSAFLNAVEAALLQLIAVAPSADAQVLQWDNTNTRIGPALILNKNVDPAAAIAKSKLDFTGANGIVNADVAGAAAIAYSKLVLTGSITNTDIANAAAIAISKLADPGSGKVIGSLGAGAVALLPPGSELAYAEVTTASTNIVPTTEGTATTYLTATSFAADGTAVWVEVSIPTMDTPALAGQNLYIVLFEGATSKGNLIRFASPAAAVTRAGLYQKRKLTPAAGATVYTAKAYVDSGTGVLRAGAGSVGVEVPAFIRVSKA